MEDIYPSFAEKLSSFAYIGRPVRVRPNNHPGSWAKGTLTWKDKDTFRLSDTGLTFKAKDVVAIVDCTDIILG